LHNNSTFFVFLCKKRIFVKYHTENHMSAWQANTFSNKEINEAGNILLNGDAEPASKYLKALNTIESWRASHAYPLLVFQNYLRQRAKEIDSQAIVAQRLKKRSSILSKLERCPKMQLSRMQDIGGCRVILKDIKSVRELCDTVRNSRRRHILKNEKDYISNPKVSGYRGVHLVYQYVSESNQQFKNILLEIQIRTLLQHLWATSVETVGVFVQHSLKSSQGPDTWLDFFKIVSSLFAMEEQCCPVPDMPESKDELVAALKNKCEECNIIPQLRAYNVVADHISNNNRRDYYYVLILDYDSRKVTIYSFPKNDIKGATSLYGSYEGQDHIDAVLVSVDSISTLRKAYPNYFLNVKEFLRKIEGYLK